MCTPPPLNLKAPAVLVTMPRALGFNMVLTQSLSSATLRFGRMFCSTPVEIIVPGDLDETSDFVAVTEEDLSVACGCSGTPAPAAGADPSPIAGSPPAPTPTTETGGTSGAFGGWSSCSWIVVASAFVVALVIGG